MKKKIILLVILMLSCLALLCACGKEEYAPDGMKRASDKKIVDYVLYVPESWVVDTPSFSVSEKETQKLAVSMAHVSPADPSSVSVAQWNLTSENTPEKWWEDYKNDITTVLGATVTLEDEDITVCAKSGKKYEYSATVNGTEYKFMVVSTTRQGSIYVITYTSTKENYDKNLEDVSKILENIKF